MERKNILQPFELDRLTEEVISANNRVFVFLEGKTMQLFISASIKLFTTFTCLTLFAQELNRPVENSRRPVSVPGTLISMGDSTAEMDVRFVAPTYRPSIGPFEVETVEKVTLRDAARNKDLPVFVSYPKGDGKFPVIVFSHGAMASGDMEFPIVHHWTRHGYVVLCPTHADSIKFRRTQGKVGMSGILAQIRGSNKGLWDDNWLQRPRDISFILDSLNTLADKIPALKGKLDHDRIGVGGHSLGAYTAQLAGGATVKIPGLNEPQSVRDPRIKAVLQLSGQGSGQQGLHRESWKDLHLPMMCVTGSRDIGVQGQAPVWRREPFALSPPGEKYFLFIEGAHHGSFTGRMVRGRLGGDPDGGGRFTALRGISGDVASDAQAIYAWVAQATTAFWDSVLRSDASAKAWLDSDSLLKQSGGKAKLERR